MRHGSTPIPVDSSWIRSVTYAADATLTVRFRRGTVYRYFTVPRCRPRGLPHRPVEGRLLHAPHSERLPPHTGRRASTAVLTPC